MKLRRLFSAFTVAALMSSASAHAAATSEPSPFGIGWGYLYGQLGVKPRPYVGDVRELGGGFSRVILFWDQIEPEKGRFNWSDLDLYVGELRHADEGFVTLYSASKWATRVSAIMMPATPAKDPDDYYRFVYETVSRYRGRVRYWGNDAEPTNPAFWGGTVEEFVAQLRIFYRAVKDADPDALVVLGGCDGIFMPPGLKMPNGEPVPPIPHQEVSLAFFDHVLREAGDAFDIFDLRLYMAPETIGARVAYIRERMRANGYEKPIIGGEYGGPNFYEMPDNLQYLSIVQQWAVKPDESGTAQVDLALGRAVAELYEKMPELSPQTQMFMWGCPPELEEKLRRIQSRTIVMQNLFALEAGLKRSLLWCYSPATNERDDIMGLMFGKFSLMVNEGDTWKPTLTAHAFKRMTEFLGGVQSVKRLPIPERPAIYLFEVDRGARGPAFVVWEQRDRFSGEDQPPVEFGWTTTWKSAGAVDALGENHAVGLSDGRITLQVGATPTYVVQGE